MLYTRTAAVLLGIAAVLTLPAVVLIQSDFAFHALNPSLHLALSILGGTGAFGLIALLVCMGFFWFRCDSSPRPWRAAWFVILLAGFAFGSQVIYYLVVYLPAVRRRLRNPERSEQEALLPKTHSAHRIGPFSRPLLFVWLVLLLPTAAALVLPRIMSYRLGPTAAVLFGLWSLVVALESVIHLLVSIFRTGISRPGSF